MNMLIIETPATDCDDEQINPQNKQAFKSKRFDYPSLPIRFDNSVNNEMLKGIQSNTVKLSVKNPTIYLKNLKNFMNKCSNGSSIPPDNCNFKTIFGYDTKITSFDERLEENEKSKLKGILRWDDFSFENKEIIFKKEVKRIRKKLKDKELLKRIKTYRNNRMKEEELDDNNKGNLPKIRSNQRLDVYGNIIIKGGSNHKVSFNTVNEIKRENYISQNSNDNHNPKPKLKPEPELKIMKTKKKRCAIF